jgi:hypothetical protein
MNIVVVWKLECFGLWLECFRRCHRGKNLEDVAGGKKLMGFFLHAFKVSANAEGILFPIIATDVSQKVSDFT